jgi:hypothetical protein
MAVNLITEFVVLNALHPLFQRHAPSYTALQQGRAILKKKRKTEPLKSFKSIKSIWITIFFKKTREQSFFGAIQVIPKKKSNNNLNYIQVSPLSLSTTLFVFCHFA